MKRFSVYFNFVVACMLATLSFARVDDSTLDLGNISGRVVDSESGHGMAGATIALLEDPRISGKTDLDGGYSFDDVTTGEYTIRVFKGGYEPFDVKGVAVLANETTRINIPLLGRKDKRVTDAASGRDEPSAKSDIFELAAFEVTAEVIRNSDAILLENRQRSVSIRDAIDSIDTGDTLVYVPR